MSTPATGNPMAEQEERLRETLRAKHQVQLVNQEAEGTAISKLAGGIFGFTYSPTAEDVPVFRKRPFQAFEVHRVSGGEEYLVGFVTPAVKQQLEEAKSEIQVQLYPEPWKEAAEIIAIDYDRIAKSKRMPSREEGNFVKIDVSPA